MVSVRLFYEKCNDIISPFCVLTERKSTQCCIVHWNIRSCMNSASYMYTDRQMSWELETGVIVLTFPGLKGKQINAK